MTNADKRSVATDALETLGMQPIPDNSGRDAIHLAVEPVIAASCLFPGQHVGLVNGEASAEAPEKIGIVDPFVTGTVLPGTRFWLVIYPRKITSLRHVWSHPAFDDEAETTPATGKSFSEEWMRRWAIKHMGYDYYGDTDRVSDEAAFQNALRAGEDNHVGPYEDARDHIDSEWWGHWEAITGKRGNRDEYFSCSC